MSTVLPCSVCSQPMPPLPPDLAAMLAQGVAVKLTHDVCPDAAQPPPVGGRVFVVRVQIVEVTGEPDSAPAEAELAAFRCEVRADTLEAAMRPLADALGEQWQKAEKHSGIADPRA